ncbi:hypothetical protein [Nitrososphaera sp.]|uniref:hypothetical protein n=1 Tax=Nitrososphaera sp. TaxID=1971748 RepID=UPI00307DDFBA
MVVVSLSHDDKLVLIQYAIEKYDSEKVLKEKLAGILVPKDIERGIDTLIGTQRVRRIGPETIQNNKSAMGELPELPDHLKPMVDAL